MYRPSAPAAATPSTTPSTTGRASAPHAARRAAPTPSTDGEFELHFQPLIDLRPARSVRAEALVRWNHPEHGLLGARPVHRAGRAVRLHPAAHPLGHPRGGAAAARRGGAAGHRVGVAVNLSVRNLYDPDLPAARRPACCAEPGLARRSWSLELTESELMDDPAWPARCSPRSTSSASAPRSTTSAPATRRSPTCGTCPLSEIKIDRSFVAGMHRPRRRPHDRPLDDRPRPQPRPRGGGRGRRARRRPRCCSAASAATWPRASTSARPLPHDELLELARRRAGPTIGAAAPSRRRPRDRRM